VRSIGKPDTQAKGTKLTIVEGEAAKATDTAVLSGG
jgi:hypothetical protein